MGGELSDRASSRLSTFVQGLAGIRLPPAKKLMLESRQRRRPRALSLSSHAAYRDYALGHGLASPCATRENRNERSAVTQTSPTTSVLDLVASHRSISSLFALALV